MYLAYRRAFRGKLGGMSYTEEFLDFIAASPSSYHAAEEVSRQLREVGFDLQDESEEWSAAPGGHVMVRGGAVAAWYVPQEADKNSGFRIVGSHTDSPGLVLKPTPDFSAAGWQQVAVEVYGGALLHTWFDRELTVAGQIVTKDGTRHVVNTCLLYTSPSPRDD